MTTSGAVTALRAERRRARANGWWGMAVFVATEGTLFGTLIGSYFYLRFNTAQWPPPGSPEPKVLLPLVLAAVLVATSALLQLALTAARSGGRAAAWWTLLAAFAVQCAYLGVQVHLFAGDVTKLHPEQNAYASIYETLVGAAHAHVAVGLLLDLFLLARLATGLTAYRLVGLNVVAFYWHFVNALTVVVVLTQISPSL
jgi:heme/copper-type cytochrome/quinol oxidase subunit 3